MKYKDIMHIGKVQGLHNWLVMSSLELLNVLCPTCSFKTVEWRSSVQCLVQCFQTVESSSKRPLDLKLFVPLDVSRYFFMNIYIDRYIVNRGQSSFMSIIDGQSYNFVTN